MDFRIADTFTASLARLNGDEQKAAKTTAFDLQVDPAGNGMSFHRLDRGKDPNFWSVRVNRDVRMIVHKTAGSLLLCYVDHHDKAYQWAERRKLETHPTTGAAQIVEIRERVQEIAVPKYVERAATTSGALFAAYSDERLLAYGVPPEWLADVRAADEDIILDLVDHLPSEAAEALLELATGGTPDVRKSDERNQDPFLHPDAQRRFRTMSDQDELARALEYPWEKWTVFLHPAQRQMVERDYSGPARVSGSAGTGKTVVALHRAVHLTQKDEDARVLLSTFSDTLANVLRSNLFRLSYNKPRLAERIHVTAMDAIGAKLYTVEFGKPAFANREKIRSLLQDFSAQIPGLRAKTSFLLAEWEDVVDTWQLDSWEQYRDAKRIGRKTRLPEAQRAIFWQLFDMVQKELERAGEITKAQMFSKLAEAMTRRRYPVYDYIVVDEAQDIGVQQLRFLASIAGERGNGLFFAGDQGQRIFQQPFSWKSLGVDVRGRSLTLKINYRTSHQIRSQADRLLGPEVSDVDGNLEIRKGTVSVFNGPEPIVRTFPSPDDEVRAVARWLRQCIDGGVLPHEIGVFVRTETEISRAGAAVGAAGLQGRVLGEDMATEDDSVSITTMHLAKGMEFRAVAVMACDDEVIPLQSRIESASDEGELTEIYDTERHLLYVACTRARDSLHVSAAAPSSEFLDDLLSS